MIASAIKLLLKLKEVHFSQTINISKIYKINTMKKIILIAVIAISVSFVFSSC
jgi:hypothetical protein